MHRPIVIANPRSGSARAEKVLDLLSQRLFHRQRAEILRTEHAGHATEIARGVPPSCPMVIVAGGDGTISEVENGLMAGAGRGRALPPIGIIPLGTANTLATELGIPKTVRGALDVIARGNLRRLDLGEARFRQNVFADRQAGQPALRLAGLPAYRQNSSAEITRYFHCMAGAGFDAEVARIYQTVRAGKSRPHHYVLPVLRTLKDFNLPRIRVVMDGEELTDSAASVIVGNTRAYAILMAVAAHAQPDDGLLDACIFFGRTRKDMALAVLNVLFRCHLATESTLYRVGRKISLRSDSPVLVQLDGDFVGCLPLDIEVKPLAVSFFVP